VGFTYEVNFPIVIRKNPFGLQLDNGSNGRVRRFTRVGHLSRVTIRFHEQKMNECISGQGRRPNRDFGLLLRPASYHAIQAYSIGIFGGPCASSLMARSNLKLVTIIFSSAVTLYGALVAEGT
jgi:hypothetical protein